MLTHYQFQYKKVTMLWQKDHLDTFTKNKDQSDMKKKIRDQIETL